MKDRKFVFASVLIGIFLLTVGLTYAYFSLTVSGNDVAETINVDTIKLELKYTDGKVALIYPSDYMYASSACYNDDTKKGYDSSGSSPYDTDYRSETCKSTNWLLDTSNWVWTVSPTYHSSLSAMLVDYSGNVHNSSTDNSYGGLCQSVYLDTNVNYVSGDGTSDNPFVIE